MGIVSSAIGAVGSGISSALGVYGQQQTNATTSKEARKNREWQEYMSNTAHQREVTDLRNAGLNPILSAFGSGASVGSGATATGFKNPFADVSGDVFSARQLEEVEKKRVAIEQELKEAATEREETQSDLNRANAAKAAVETAYVGENTKVAESNRILNDAMLGRVAQDIATGKALAGLHSAQARSVSALTYGDPRRIVGSALEAAQNALKNPVTREHISSSAKDISSFPDRVKARFQRAKNSWDNRGRMLSDAFYKK